MLGLDNQALGTHHWIQSKAIVRRASSGWTSSKALAPSLKGNEMLPSITRSV